MNKYQRTITNYKNESITVDVYDVLVAFDVTNPAIAHAVKKLLAPGTRGEKGWVQDVKEATGSLNRAVEIYPSPSNSVEDEPIIKKRPMPFPNLPSLIGDTGIVEEKPRSVRETMSTFNDTCPPPQTC